MEKDDRSTRRDFVRRMAALGLASVGAGSLLSACGGGDGEGAGGEQGAAAEGDFSCTDVANLSESEVQTRQALQYTDDSPEAGEYCDNCVFWEPAAAGEQCGGCQVLPGPVHPEGWCTSWAAAPA